MSEQLAAGLAHHQAGRLDEARAAYRALLDADPSSVDGWHLLGVIAIQKGEIDQAIGQISRALTFRDDIPEIHNNLGNALRMAGRDAEALVSFERALALRPGFFEALNNSGSALRALGRISEAWFSLQAALAVKPESPDVIMNLGNVLKDQRRFEEALTYFDRALALDATLAEAWSNRAAVLSALGRSEDALQSITRALNLHSGDPEFWVNFGHALHDLGQFDGAKNAFEHALSLRPNYVLALCNLGVILVHLKEFDRAIEVYEQALVVEPGSHLAKFGLSLVLLRLGQYERGWPLYESRWWMSDFVGVYPYRDRVGLWDGRSSIAGRRLLVWAEQGLGDTIQFSRFVPALAAMGAEVEMHVPKSLGALMSGIEGVWRVHQQNDPIEAIDLHVPLMSLPAILGAPLNVLPSTREAYVFGDRDNFRRWFERLGPKRKSRIGIMWSGGTQAKLRHRSMSLAEFSLILDNGFEFVSLAKDVQGEDVAALSALPEIRHFGAEQSSLDDAASLISLVDLVVTIDTSIAHLAGAMGKPTWVLLAHDADWRWLEGTDRSPWYASMRLFRQDSDGRWEPVLRRVKRELLSAAGQLIVR